MSLRDTEVQDQITAFWTLIASQYESHPGNVPAVGSLEYEAWIEAIERLLPAAPSDVLDLGTGTGFVALIAGQLGHRVVGLDLSSAMLSAARAGAERRALHATFAVGDAVAPPLEEESLDAIICRHLFWTLREPHVALTNWRRLLRTNGRALWSSMDSGSVRRKRRKRMRLSPDTTQIARVRHSLRCTGIEWSLSPIC